MFNFLKGKMGGLGGQQQGGGFMQRMQQGMQRPQFQQGMAGLGAQMMGLDPALGQMAAQGMQGRRMQKGFDRSIQPIGRERLPVQMPGLQPEAAVPMPMRKPMLMPQGVPGAESQGGGAWQDPRLLEMLRGRNFQRY